PESAARSRSRGASGQAEHRMLRRRAAHLLLRGVRADPVEEHPHLELPASQVRARHGRLLTFAELDGREDLTAFANQQPSLATGPQVACPLRLAAWSDEVALPLELEQVDGRATQLS